MKYKLIGKTTGQKTFIETDDRKLYEVGHNWSFITTFTKMLIDSKKFVQGKVIIHGRANTIRMREILNKGSQREMEDGKYIPIKEEEF